MLMVFLGLLCFCLSGSDAVSSILLVKYPRSEIHYIVLIAYKKVRRCTEILSFMRSFFNAKKKTHERNILLYMSTKILYIHTYVHTVYFYEMYVHGRFHFTK